MPAAAMPAPMMLCRVTRSCSSHAARPIVKNTWNWMTSEDRPGRHPELHAEKEQAELEHADRESIGDERAPWTRPDA